MRIWKLKEYYFSCNLQQKYNRAIDSTVKYSYQKIYLRKIRELLVLVCL